MKNYTLDSLYYYTAPGLAFDAMLNITDVKLKLLTDIDMVNFIERVLGEAFRNVAIDMLKQTTSI